MHIILQTAISLETTQNMRERFSLTRFLDNVRSNISSCLFFSSCTKVEAKRDRPNFLLQFGKISTKVFLKFLDAIFLDMFVQAGYDLQGLFCMCLHTSFYIFLERKKKCHANYKKQTPFRIVFNSSSGKPGSQPRNWGNREAEQRLLNFSFEFCCCLTLFLK